MACWHAPRALVAVTNPIQGNYSIDQINREVYLKLGTFVVGFEVSAPLLETNVIGGTPTDDTIQAINHLFQHLTKNASVVVIGVDCC